MTAENEEKQSTEDIIPTLPESESQSPPHPEICELFEYLSQQEKIIFKSQQIDDPELNCSQKVQIAKQIYEQNRQTFLSRFGIYLLEQHLNTFARLAISEGSKPLKNEENYDEMQYMLHDYQQRLKTRQRDVKNRRYAYMQQLIKEGEYFSEQEMMGRQPELYQELVGQYLDEEEKKFRDSYDVRNTSFSGILMHSLERQQMDEVMANVEVNKQNCDALEQQKVEEATNELEFETISEEIPVSFRQQWGNFDSEQIPCSSSKNIPSTSSHLRQILKPITAGERDILRQEFLGILYEQFLAGEDKDFDYTLVDDNYQLDDLNQLNQDKEDEYFEDSEDSEDAADIQNDDVQDEKEESEDELDIYMNHLSKHHTLQKKYT